MIQKKVNYDKFKAFIDNYPRELKRSVHYFSVNETLYASYNDDTIGAWPDGIVAIEPLYSGDRHSCYYVPKEDRKYTIVVNFEKLYNKINGGNKNNGVD